MRKQRLILLICLLVFTTVAFSCGGATPTPTSKPTPTPAPSSSPTAASTPTPKPSPTTTPTKAPVKAVTIATSGVGGMYYVSAVGIAALSNKYSGVSANAEPGPGSDATARAIRDGFAEMGIINAWVAQQAYSATGDFAKEGKVPMQFISSGLPSVFAIFVKANSGIQSIPDLRGKKFQMIHVGNTVYETYVRALLESYGMSEADLKPVALTSAREGADALIAGSIDAWIISGGYPAAALNLEVSRTIDVRLVSIDQDKAKIVSEKYAWLYPTTIPAGTYKGQDKDVLTMGYGALWVAREDLPEDVVYNITKAVYGNFKEFTGIAKEMADWDIEKGAISNPALPVHPGAVKYYKEINKWTPEMEKIQQRLLAQK